MAPIIEAESTLTDRYQTTVPEPVRRALKLSKRDRLHYTVLSTGEVVLARAGTPEEDDPALAPFLELLAQDLAAHPERVQALDAAFVNRLKRLVADVDIALDAPLPDEEA
jgi:antitoxin PrlF